MSDGGVPSGEAAVEAGAAFGQLATPLAGGGLLLSASRLVMRETRTRSATASSGTTRTRSSGSGSDPLFGGARCGRPGPLPLVPRRPRQELAGAIHHVYARGNDRRVIFADDADRRTYLALLRQTERKLAWHCLMYCLMDNHVHLLVETPQPNLGRGMQRIHGRYAQVVNARHQHVGHVFQGRYGAVRVERDEQLWALVTYIARNPVKAGLCAEPEDWPWGSHASLARHRGHPGGDAARLLTRLAAAGGDGWTRYRRCVAAGDAAGG